MNTISKSMAISISVEKAFYHFLHEFHAWWPSAYTWSQENLQQIWINGGENGLCTEIGPYGFRCDWGRVISIEENDHIKMNWQISARREPIPDPFQGSTLLFTFIEERDGTRLDFQHYDFENHGEDAEYYREMLDSAYGWDYILNLYKEYCEQGITQKS